MSRNDSLVFLPTQLVEGSSRFEIEADIEGLDLAEYTFSVPLRCEIVLERTGDRIDAHLDLETSLKLSCSRCGESMRQDICASADVTFLPEVKNKEDADEQDATDLEFYSEVLDLRDIVRDMFLLALPIAPLCSEDCRGLCPSCGANLNRENCKCNIQGNPSTFEKLRRLVDE